MTIDDKDIIDQMKRDAERGCRLLMEKYGEPVYWHLRRLLVSHADAQDVAQESFVRVFRSIGQLKSDASLKAWIYRIASREALRTIEKRKGETPTSLLSAHDSILAGKGSSPLSESFIDYSDLEAVKLQEAIKSLPPKQQLVFTMRYYDEMSYDDIAEAMDTTTATAKVNYHLAKEKIVNFFKNND